jgi:hypothetical protein
VATTFAEARHAVPAIYQFREFVSADGAARPNSSQRTHGSMQMNNGLTADPIDIVATFAAQRPRHRRQCACFWLFFCLAAWVTGMVIAIASLLS